MPVAVVMVDMRGLDTNNCDPSCVVMTGQCSTRIRTHVAFRVLYGNAGDRNLKLERPVKVHEIIVQGVGLGCFRCSRWLLQDAATTMTTPTSTKTTLLPPKQLAPPDDDYVCTADLC